MNNINYTFSICTPSEGRGRFTSALSLPRKTAHQKLACKERSLMPVKREGSELKLYQYSEFSEESYSPENGAAVLFGIAVYGFINGAKKELLKIHRVSADKFKVDMIADLCTREQLEPVHIYDVIDDNLL